LALSLFTALPSSALQTAPSAGTVLWSSSAETGNLLQWVNSGGGKFNVGSGDSAASQDFAHSGLWSVKMTAPASHATVVYRSREPGMYPDLNYTVWYYFPQLYTVPSGLNVMHWISDSPTSGRAPFYLLNVGNRPDGSMYFYLQNWQTRQQTSQTQRDIPVGQWFKVDVNYQCAGDGTGHLVLWQDGVQLFELPNAPTRFADGNCEWSVSNHTANASPSPVTIYVDDAAISTSGGSNGGAVSSLLSIHSSLLPTGVTGRTYSTSLAAGGGNPPYTWSLASGALPPGLALNGNGTISGTPTTPGTFSFNAHVGDAASQVATSTLVTIQVESAPPLAGNAMWSADHETGDDSQWYENYGGGQFNSGSGNSVATQDRSHTGSWGLRMTISTATESGTRMFRWGEPRAISRLRYTAWYYFPQRYTVHNYWNLFQWKSRNGGAVDPFFVLNVGNRSDGAMHFYLYDWQTRRAYSQSAKNIPVNQWVKIDAYYHCTGSQSGRVTFWQDDTLLFDVPNVRTGYSDNNCEWSIDNYSDGLSPSPATIYLDDASIVPE
jgi:hypothetical protein